jgi:O-antigen ligase
MNWQAIRNIRHEQVGAFLALLIIVFLPNYGIEKTGPNPVVPAFLLSLFGIRLVWRERLALFTGSAQRRWLMVFPLLLVPVLLSAPGSLNTRVSLSIAMVLVLYFFTGVALVRALRSAPEREWLVKWVSIVLIVWVFDALVQYQFGRDLLGVEISSNGRVLGPFADNTRLPFFLALLLPVLLAWLMPRGMAVTLTGFAVTAGVAMLSGVRAVLVFLMVVTVGLFQRMPGRRRRWLVVLLLIVLTGTAVMLSPVLQGRFARLTALQNPTFETADRFLSGRLIIADVAMNMVADRPLTGVGAGAFQAAYRRYSTLPGDRFLRENNRVYHAHQLYIGLAAETGLIGLMAFIVIIVLSARWYHSAPQAQRHMAWPFALGLMVYIFPINSQPVLYQQWLFPVLLLLLAAMLAALEAPSGGESVPPQPYTPS